MTDDRPIVITCGVCHVPFKGDRRFENLERHLLVAHEIGIDRGSHRKVAP